MLECTDSYRYRGVVTYIFYSHRASVLILQSIRSFYADALTSVVRADAESPPSAASTDALIAIVFFAITVVPPLGDPIRALVEFLRSPHPRLRLRSRSNVGGSGDVFRVLLFRLG